jgi:hypothetical protein
LDRLARETAVGDWLGQGAQLSPLQNKAPCEKVKGFLEDARRNGRTVAGGGVLQGEADFVQPTIMGDLPGTARLVREEQSGPGAALFRSGKKPAVTEKGALCRLLIAVFGPLNLMTPLGWKWALFVWGYALAWFLIENRVRLLAYRIFDPEQPPLLRRDGTLAW